MGFPIQADVLDLRYRSWSVVMLSTISRTGTGPKSTDRSILDNSTQVDYWLEYLAHQPGLEMWEATIEQALGDWHLDLGWRLLREVRQKANTTEQQAVVRFWEGRLAAQQGDLERAADCYEAAIDKLPLDHRTIPALYGDLGMIYRLVGNVRAALEMHQRQHQWAEEHSPGLLTEVLDQIGLDYEMGGNAKRAEHHFKRALTLCKAFQNDLTIADIRKHLGLVQWRQGKADDAQENLDAALNIFERDEEWYDVAQVEGNLGNVAYLRGNIDDAEYHYLKALRIFNELDVVFDKIGLLINLGGLAEAREMYREAAGFYQEALALATDLGNLQGQRDALLNLGVVAARQRQWQDIPDYYRRALLVGGELGDRRSVWDIRRRLARFYLRYTVMRVFGWLSA